ncbi:DUF3667 domain-containing protein [Winogradskyella aurantia]|uniref:Zinc-ribbon domain-containing protein n=1 Tax=Winogradskyella aurantia TaxID=1915063 RepID=A0A265URK3_9FLAO|nr:DUF3667 domain-containing protein [Winogradskyella aurantia]OZV67924.1 hypothetical protein CA834_09705 [Winogradskyella aurantia]
MDCKNCHNSLRDSQRFCDECGAKILQNRLTLKVIANQINEEFLSIDNRLLSTFITLFTKPEDVIVGYIDGTRKKYVDVLQYFAFALTLAGIQVFLMSTFFKEALDINMYEKLENMPGQENNPFKDMDFGFFTNYQGLFYIIGVPISAFSTWFVYYLVNERRYNFTEHIVINLYYSAQVIIITAVLSILFLLFGLNYLIVSTLLMIPYFIYWYFILKRVFNERHVDTIAKLLLVIVVYIAGYIILGLILSLIAAVITIGLLNK